MRVIDCASSLSIEGLTKHPEEAGEHLLEDIVGELDSKSIMVIGVIQADG